MASSGFEGHHVMVTGGSSGIGLATAEAFGRLGARVSLIARGRERLRTAVDTLRRDGIDAVFRQADVADRSSLTLAVGELVATNGSCDILIASAGLCHPGYFQEIDDEVFRKEMDVNYFGTLNAVRAVAPLMIEQRSGQIVGISSGAGLLGVFGYTAYGPTKFAVRGLMESLRAEMVPHGVRVHCVYPADIDTPQFAFEKTIRPSETAAITGIIKPLPPQRVAKAIIRGVRRDRFAIYTDTQTRLLAGFSGHTSRLIHKTMDRRARKATGA
jgi:3-dehydrosphinganine reductase